MIAVHEYSTMFVQKLDTDTKQNSYYVNPVFENVQIIVLSAMKEPNRPTEIQVCEQVDRLTLFLELKKSVPLRQGWNTITCAVKYGILKLSLFSLFSHHHATRT